MNNLDAILKDEHESARLIEEVNGDLLNDAVFERASAFEDPLLACIKQEVIVPLGRLESIEDALDARIESFVQRAGADWADEQINAVLAAEKPMPLGVAERIETRLFDRIENEPLEQTRVESRYLWPMTPVLAALRTVGAVTALVAVITVGALYIARPYVYDTPLTTLITQAYGSAYRDDLVVSVTDGSTVTCKPEGSLTLVNKAGTVALHDDIALTLARASARTVRYSVSLPSASTSYGAAAFTVAKRSRRQQFTVGTPYYDVHVVGTTFTVAQERGKAISTSVKEGTVRITSRIFGDTVLTAGQTLWYAPESGRPRITSNAAGVADSMGRMFSPELAQCRLVIESAPSRSAVYLNDVPAGVTPFAAVLPSGTYHVSVRAEGHWAVDSSVTLGDTPISLRFALKSVVRESVPAMAVRHTRKLPTRDIPPRVAQAEITADIEQLLQEAQRAESDDWKKALDLYRQLAASPRTPPLYRETALFSLSRLTVDKLRDTVAALNGFSRYVILYPRGTFAGEALLRLSELELTRNPASAVDYFRKFLAISPSHPRKAEVAYHLGLLMQQHNEYTEALSLLRIALQQTKASRQERRREIERMIAEVESLIAVPRKDQATSRP